METLWSPWRMKYILQDKVEGCVLCQKADSHEDRANLVLFRGEHCFILLNLYPYNPGHLMVVPYCHRRALTDLSAPILHELFDLVQLSTRVIGERMAPQGFNIGLNLGRTAGAGIADHLHVHVVPRWDGDTNFMPVVGETKVLPEELSTTYDRLQPGFGLDV